MAELSLRRWPILRREDLAEALDRVPMAREASSAVVATHDTRLAGRPAALVEGADR